MGRVPEFKFIAVAGAILLAAGSFLPVRAQDPDDLKRGVARISLIDGDVSVRRGDSGDWVAGIINAPLMAGDYIASGPNSRAEVQFDNANLLRMGANVQLHLTQLEDGRYQMELARGTISFGVLRPSNANIEVDTPSISIKPSKQGVYRITVNDAGETQVTARAGEVEVFTPRGDEWVNTGQTLMARGAAADAEYQIVQAGPLDDWDRWNISRDQAMQQAVSPQYVGPGVTGTEDMDGAGTWSYDPAYGNVWAPTVAAGWAPYQCGRWVWEDWYGWTWVGCEPWGWAPYHYGRWYWRTGFGWAWYPGVFGVRHYWSPALVGFFGFGGGVGIGVGFGFGNIGWVALAPYEMFHPWWGRGFYGRPGGFGVTNGFVANSFRNARVAGGISAVSTADFRAGRFGSTMHYSGSQIGAAGMVTGRMPISPTSANLRFSDRAAANVPRGGTFSNTHFFTHQQPGAAQRMPFSQQQRGFESAARTGGAGGVGSNYSRGTAPTIGGSSRNGGSNGWRRFSETPSQTPGAGNRGNTGAAGGWRGAGGGSSMQSQRTPASGYGGSAYGSGAQRSSGPQSVRIAPPVARERSSTPSYSAPRGGGGRPSGGGGHGGGHGHR
ncbi:MAG TPA: DUF6600 domain-containing protein [Bryobacteraceae bacterium]|nr:DUF6600 domain-containing protein [Bryobacteraceae bacterium]